MWTGFAADLGASNGRTVLGHYDGRTLNIEESTRFANVPVRLGDTLYWDFLRLYQDVAAGLHQALAKGAAPVSMGIDTWGVDFGLVGRSGELFANPRHYRDGHNERMMPEVFRIIAADALYGRTGIQTIPVNTVFQLMYLAREEPELLGAAHRLLLMPDLFNYFFTGELASEFTAASTTQLYSPLLDDWDRSLMTSLGLPEGLFGPVVKPPQVLGKLRAEVASGAKTDVNVVNVGGHDTASAVFGLGSSAPDFAYVSSGTWFLVGVLSPRPVINDMTFRHNFTNEGGVGGNFRVLKNVTGLWMLQEVRRGMEGRGIGFAELVALGARERPLQAVIDPDAPDFRAPEDMTRAIRAYCRRTGQPAGEDYGAIARVVLESVVLKCKWVIERLEGIVGHSLPVIRLVGGGVHIPELGRWTADATGKVVLAGPAEAAAVGNLAAQLVACGELSGQREVDDLLERSFARAAYYPGSSDVPWDDGYARLLALLGT